MPEAYWRISSGKSCWPWGAMAGGCITDKHHDFLCIHGDFEKVHVAYGQRSPTFRELWWSKRLQQDQYTVTNHNMSFRMSIWMYCQIPKLSQSTPSQTTRSIVICRPIYLLTTNDRPRVTRNATDPTRWGRRQRIEWWEPQRITFLSLVLCANLWIGGRSPYLYMRMFLSINHQLCFYWLPTQQTSSWPETSDRVCWKSPLGSTFGRIFQPASQPLVTGEGYFVVFVCSNVHYVYAPQSLTKSMLHMLAKLESYK